MNSEILSYILLSDCSYQLKFAAASDLIVDEEYQPKKQKFDLSKYGDHQSEFLFRFKKHEILELADAFELPDRIYTSDRSKFEKVEATCILLRRLAYPNRLGDLRLIFHRSKTQLSRIINWMVWWLETHFGFLLQSMDLFWMSENDLRKFAEAIQFKGAPLTHCVGFIDGTLRPICRPSRQQKELYSGHKRVHGLKFQSVVHPNGLISNLYGPVEGRRHDSFMLTLSGLLPKLEDKFKVGTEKYHLYGDPAYPVRPQLISPFKKSNLTVQEQQFNKAMSSVRQCVEWEFGRIVRLFAFLDFKKNLKLHLQPVGKYYKVGVILANCHACFRGSQTSDYFGINPPSVDKYLANQ